MQAIEIERLRKEYEGGIVAVGSVDLEVEEGQVFAVRSKPLSAARAQELWRARRKMIVWLAMSRARLGSYTEFAAIYEAQTDSGEFCMSWIVR